MKVEGVENDDGNHHHSSGSEISWPESEQDLPSGRGAQTTRSPPITPRRESKTRDVLNHKRKRLGGTGSNSDDETAGLAPKRVAKGPSTPVTTRVAQLQTPPDSKRRNRERNGIDSGGGGAGGNSSSGGPDYAGPETPSKRAAQDSTHALVLEIDSRGQELGSLGESFPTPAVVLTPLERPQAEMSLSGVRVKLHLYKRERLLEASNRSRDVLRNALRARQSELDLLRRRLTVLENERETSRAGVAALRRELAQVGLPRPAPAQGTTPGTRNARD